MDVSQRAIAEGEDSSGAQLSEEEVYDALLGASLSDDVVGKSAQLALQRLGMESNHKLVQRAVDMLSCHAKALAEEPVANNVSQRAALFRLLSSIVCNYNAALSTEPADGAADVDVSDFLIEQVVNDIECACRTAPDEEAAAELVALAEAAEQLLVQLASHHILPVLTRLLSRLEGTSMFQQQKAQAAARRLTRPGAQWFAIRSSSENHLTGILSAIEAVARCKPEQLSPHSKKVLAAMLPVIGLATSPVSKEAWSRAMCALCEAMQAHNDELSAAVANAQGESFAPDASRLGIDASTRMAMLAGYDVLAMSWTASNDAVVQRSSFISLAAMTALLPPEDLRSRIASVVSKLCSMLIAVNSCMSVRVCTGDGDLQSQASIFVKSLCSVVATACTRSRDLSSAAQDCTQVLSSVAPQIMKAVLPLACRPPDVFDKRMLATFNNTLECFRLLASVDACCVADFLLSALTLDGKHVAKPKAPRDYAQRHWGALSALTYVASRVPQALAQHRRALVSSALLAAANSADPLVRVQLANLIMAIAPLGYLKDDVPDDATAAQDCLRFLVASVSCCFVQLQLAAAEAPQGGGVGSRWFRAKAKDGLGAAGAHDALLTHQWWWPRGGQWDSSGGSASVGAVGHGAVEQMRSVCGNALYLLATKRYGAHSEALLWPSILTFLADAQFARSLPEICRAVVGVSTHALGALGAHAMRVDYLTHPSIMPPPALLARLLVPLCASANASHGAHTHVHVHMINALRALVVNFPPPMHAHLQMQLPMLLEGGACPSGAEDKALAWNARVCALVRSCLEPAEEAFSVALGEALMEQRALHDGDEAMNESTNMLLGAVLSAVSADRSFVRRGLQNVFCETEHGSMMESRGCAHAFEACGDKHFAAAIEVLEQVQEQVLKEAKEEAAAPARASASWLRLSDFTSAAAGLSAALPSQRRHVDDARVTAVATALVALAKVLCVATRQDLHRYMHAALALAHAHLARTPLDLEASSAVVMDNARVTFIELVGQAVVKHAAFLHENVVAEHVDRVLQAVPALVHLRAPSLPALEKLALNVGLRTQEQVTGGGASALKFSLRLARACEDVCKLQSAFTHRSFEQLLVALTAIMEQLGVSQAAAGYEADEETEAAQVQRALSASLSAAVAALRHNMPSTTGLVLSPRAGPRELALACSVMQALQRFSQGPCQHSRLRACSLLLHVLVAVTSPLSPALSSSAPTVSAAAAAALPPAAAPCTASTDERAPDALSSGVGLFRYLASSTESAATATSIAPLLLAKLAAFFVPRLADPSGAVRAAAYDALSLLDQLLSQDPPAQRLIPRHDTPRVANEGEAQTPTRAVLEVLPALRRLMEGAGLVAAVELLLLATGDDSQPSGAQAAAAALSLLLEKDHFDDAEVADDDGGGGHFRTSALRPAATPRESILSAPACAVLARAVVGIGAAAARDSLQHRAASECLRHLARRHTRQVLRVVLSLDLIDAASDKSCALRRFSVACLSCAMTGSRSGGGGRGGGGAGLPAVMRVLCELLFDVRLLAHERGSADPRSSSAGIAGISGAAGYTSLRDLAAAPAAPAAPAMSGCECFGAAAVEREDKQAEETRGSAQDVHAHKKQDEQAQKKQASFADARAAHISKDHVLGESGLGVAVPAGGCRCRSVARRQIVRLMTDLLEDAACRATVEHHKALLSATLVVHVGCLALHRTGICHTRSAQTRTEDAQQQQEPARRQQQQQQQQQQEAVRSSHDWFALWQRDEDDDDSWPESKACVHYFLLHARFQQLAAPAGAASEADLWARLAEQDEAVEALEAWAYQMFASGLPYAMHELTCVLASLVQQTEEAADLAQKSAGVVALAALARAVADDAMAHASQAAQHAQHGGREYSKADTLLALARLLLPHVSASSSSIAAECSHASASRPASSSGNECGRSRLVLPVRVRSRVISSLKTLLWSCCSIKAVLSSCTSCQAAEKSLLWRCCQDVVDQCGLRLVRLLMLICTEGGADVLSAPDKRELPKPLNMCLEESALVAQETARRQRHAAQLVHEAASAFPSCLLSISRQEARGVAKDAYKCASGQWTAMDPMLRAAAAAWAAALTRLSQPAEPVEAGAHDGGGGGGGGDESVSAMGFEMLVEVLVGLGDAHLQVRVACKRAARSMLLGLLGEHAEVATLANSSALDERWQTDLPNFMHQWLRLLSVHQPAQMTRYISLVTQGVAARRPDAVCVVAQIAGALLRLRCSVAPVARALLMLLGHPDSTVRSCAAEALQYFLPAPAATVSDGLTCTPKAALFDSKNSGDDEEEAIALRLLERGNADVQKNCMLDAVAQYTRGLECGASAETRATLSSNRAAAYCRLEMWAEALADACACAELQPRWAVAFKSKGAALHGLGQHAEALESYRVALSLDPADQDILLFLNNSEEFCQAEAEAQKEDVQHMSAYATEAVEALPQAAGGASSRIEGGNESGGAREVMTRWLKEEEGGEEEGEDKEEKMKAETTADEELDILNGPGGHEHDDAVEGVHPAQAQQHHHAEPHPKATPTGVYGGKDYGKEAGTNSSFLKQAGKGEQGQETKN